MLLFIADFSVNIQVVEMDVFRQPADGVPSGAYSVETAVIDIDIVDVAYLFESFDHHSVFALFACDIVEPDISDGGRVAAVTKLFGLIDKIDFQYGLLALSDFHVAHINVLDHASAASVGLDTDHSIQFGAIHHAVLKKEIFKTA